MSEKKEEKRGRPKRIINWAKAEEYFMYGAKVHEVADALDVGRDTFRKAIKREKNMEPEDYKAKFVSKGNIELLQTMFTNALKGDKVMNIWLSKQRLGMAEPKQRVELEGSITHKAVIVELPSNGTEAINQLPSNGTESQLQLPAKQETVYIDVEPEEG